MTCMKVSRRQFTAMTLALPFLAKASSLESLTFCCASNNDLYRSLDVIGIRAPRYTEPAVAITHAPRNSGLLILADRYPHATVSIPKDLVHKIREKHLWTYVEYPAWLTEPAMKPRCAKLERAVVSSDFFGDSLPRLRILSLHECFYLPVHRLPRVSKAHLVMAKVAGFDTATFGIPNHDVYPLLFEDESSHLLIASTQLSRFITARYGPTSAWNSVWQAILEWLLQAKKGGILRWEPAVGPTWPASAQLADSAARESFSRAVRWYFNARLLIHPSWSNKLQQAWKEPDQVAPAPSQDLPSGDGRLGVLEGHASQILLDGSQKMRWWIRADCVGQTAMVMALSQSISPQANHGRIASNLVSFLMHSMIALGSRANPSSASYGLLGWNTTPNYYKGENGYDVYYVDDNARCLLGILATSALLKESHWAERLWLAILANSRLMGTRGYFQWRYDGKPLLKNGWRYYFNAPTVYPDMDYQADPWALFLWAFNKTGYKPFFERTLEGIRHTMELYPDHLICSNSLTFQQARLLLPLAWLVRIEDTAQSRSWLNRVAADLLSHQVPSGAIQEWLGDPGTEGNKPPQSNEQYGSREGPIIQSNGDPAADLLYTMDFAFIGFHEAYAATGDERFRAATDRIADFLIRAQVQSKAHPEFDGAWFRAFDFNTWDYWASNSDSGWGAWCTESGWTQSWIAATLALRILNRSLWDILSTVPEFTGFERLRQRMLPA